MVRDISIIIPCYNTAPDYLKEAIDSVKKYAGRFKYNIIVVDDGSTEPATLQYLSGINDEITELISQENKGLAGARNAGIRHTASKYLLFLDADDRIKPHYIDEGINALTAHENLGVVYSTAEVFGDKSRDNLPAKPFDIASLLITNHVPSCVVMRKKAWEEAGGFDEHLRKFEDWEFWIRVYKAGWQFRFISEPLFEYRIQQNSLVGQSGKEEYCAMIEYIYKKHWDLVFDVYHRLYATSIIYRNDTKRPFRSFFKYICHRFINRIPLFPEKNPSEKMSNTAYNAFCKNTSVYE